MIYSFLYRAKNQVRNTKHMENATGEGLHALTV